MSRRVAERHTSYTVLKKMWLTLKIRVRYSYFPLKLCPKLWTFLTNSVKAAKKN